MKTYTSEIIIKNTELLLIKYHNININKTYKG